MKNIKYSKISMRDVDIDNYLTKSQQTLPQDLQDRIVKSKMKNNGRA
jgi:hypothetical protein